jgi:hypothetical protein
MLSILHARLRVQRAPGFPCALCFQKANVQAKLERYPRSENVKLCPTVIARSEATKQSILILHLPHGLLPGACHRARIRATRWLAMTLLISLRNEGD